MKQDLMEHDLMKRDLMERDLMERDLMERDLMKHDLMERDLMEHDLIEHDPMRPNRTKIHDMTKIVLTPGRSWLRNTACVWLTVVTLAAGLAACAAPDLSTRSNAVDQTAPVRAPRMSDPLPARRVPPAAPKLDFSCVSDADCAVKNIGNCCGYFPACVNKNSPADPGAVRARCASEGMASICGFAEVSACTCSAGRCEAVGSNTRSVQ